MLTLAKDSLRVIDLGVDGSKWAHGYVPLNAEAVLLKEHKAKGHGTRIHGSVKDKSGMTQRALREHINKHEGMASRSRSLPAQKAHKAEAASARAEIKNRKAVKEAVIKATASSTRRTAPKNLNTPSKDNLIDKAAMTPAGNRTAAQKKLMADRYEMMHGTKLKLTKELPPPVKPTKKKLVTSSTENKALYKLSNQDLQHELSVARQRGDKEHAHTLQVELAQRKDKIKEVFAQSLKAKEFIHDELPKVETPAQMSRFLRGLVKIMPGLKPKIDKIKGSKTSQKIKDVKYFDAIVTTFFQTFSDHVVGGLITAGTSALGLTIFSGGK